MKKIILLTLTLCSASQILSMIDDRDLSSEVAAVGRALGTCIRKSIFPTLSFTPHAYYQGEPVGYRSMVFVKAVVKKVCPNLFPAQQEQDTELLKTDEVSTAGISTPLAQKPVDPKVTAQECTLSGIKTDNAPKVFKIIKSQ